MSRASCSKFKTYVRRHLVRTHGWYSERALDWLNTYPEYVRERYEIGEYAGATAAAIHEKAGLESDNGNSTN